MTLKRRFAQKTEELTSIEATPSNVTSMTETLPKTAQGQMLAFRDHLKESTSEIAELKTQLETLKQTVGIQAIDPKLIAASPLGNRHEDSFSDDNFARLTASIVAAGGNVQPIKVRPHPNEKGRFELVFGHRRHRACLSAGLSVMTIVETLDDHDLFMAMDRENREREDLTPYEQGMHFKRALEHGIFSSNRKLAAGLGISQGRVNKAVLLVDLPEEVIKAFASPLDLQYRWGGELMAALAKNPKGVMAKALELTDAAAGLSANQVFQALVSTSDVVMPTRKQTIGRDQSGVIIEKKGLVTVSFKKDALSPKKVRELTKLLTKLLDA